MVQAHYTGDFQHLENFFKKFESHMRSTYYEYLRTLSKEELVNIIYKPFACHGSYPAVSKRKIALRISYNGSKYHGIQRHKFLKSVGDCLQNALELTGLGQCDDSDGKSRIVFCGRTDAGVSAVGMVASLVVGSHLKSPNNSFELGDDDFDEYPYDIILNQLLPEDIRVTGWAPVSETFNARYDCVQRHYRYYFLLNGLNLDRMREAMDRILGMDDFYLLSTHSNPRAEYRRKIDEMEIFCVDEDGGLIGTRQFSSETLDETGRFADCMPENPENDIENLESAHSQFLYKPRTGNKKSKQGELGSRSSEHHGDLYCLEIKAHGFLHNMVRKIFWVVQNCGKNNPFSLTNVEIAKPHPLVFVGARFKNKLNFTNNKYNEPHFRNEEEYARIQHAISRYRLNEYDRSGV